MSAEWLEACCQAAIRMILNDQNPVFGLTPSAFEEDRARVLASGCNDFVRKPFREDLLLSKIQDYLGVQFIQAEPEPYSRASSFRKTLDTESIQSELKKVMSAEWLEACCQAAIRGSDKQVLQLITEIPPTHTLLAATLAELVNNFCFDPLLTLTQSPNNGS
ncbi:response regulator [Leptolyngbya ohadii]|uniref:response regulator n=1 Tax=Leptolyngbya ohadii TaxID=1962290 RepID=UPI000B5A14A6|nr:response regulator [Leptolyngbya ohadii]